MTDNENENEKRDREWRANVYQGSVFVYHA